MGKRLKSAGDRGILSRKRKCGQVMWFVRCSAHGKMKEFGPYDSKGLAKKMYFKIKTLDSLGMPLPTKKPYTRRPDQSNTLVELGACIYFLQSTGGQIKIGYSAQLPKRLKAIHAINGEGVRFLGAIAGTREDEARLHAQYAEERLHGEWFQLTHRLMLFLVTAGMRPMMQVEATPDLVRSIT